MPKGTVKLSFERKDIENSVNEKHEKDRLLYFSNRH